LFLSMLVVWPIGWLVVRRKGAPRLRLAVLARALAWGISVLHLLFLVLFAVGISNLSITPLAKAALAVALVATALTAGMVACAGLAWN
jgi:hypothetical protein